MIPSRPLDLGGIISESIRIVKRTYWRAPLLYLLFILPGFIFTHYGLNEVVDRMEIFVQKFSAVSPEVPTLVRDYFVGGASRTTTISIYRLEFPEFFGVIDSVNTTLQIKYPDSSRSLILSRLDSIANVVNNKNGSSAADFLLADLSGSLILTVFGLLLLILGSIGSSAALYDLSCRAFEERPLLFKPIVKLSLTHSMWLILIQYAMIFLAMITGLGVLIGITSAIAPILGVLGFLASVFILVYAGVRILFSSVALVSEELGPFEAIKRSLELTVGIFWRVFGISIIAGIFIYIVSILIQTLLSVLISPDLKWFIEFLRGNTNVSLLFAGLKSDLFHLELVFLLSSLLTVGFLPSFLTTFYYDLRTRNDGPLEYPVETVL